LSARGAALLGVLAEFGGAGHVQAAFADTRPVAHDQAAQRLVRRRKLRRLRQRRAERLFGLLPLAQARQRQSQLMVQRGLKMHQSGRLHGAVHRFS
jgi:hypothetical protein